MKSPVALARYPAQVIFRVGMPGVVMAGFLLYRKRGVLLPGARCGVQ